MSDLNAFKLVIQAVTIFQDSENKSSKLPASLHDANSEEMSNNKVEGPCVWKPVWQILPSSCQCQNSFERNWMFAFITIATRMFQHNLVTISDRTNQQRLPITHSYTNIYIQLNRNILTLVSKRFSLPFSY